MKKLVTTVTLLCCLAAALDAKVQLPSIFSDSMVLQRETAVSLWGKAEPGEKIKIETSWNGAKYQVKTGAEGRWSVQVATGSAGGPYTITFSDASKDKTVLRDVMLGEVWICGGQSNMQMPVRGWPGQRAVESQQTIRDSWQHPLVRYFKVEMKAAAEPQEDCEGSWHLPTPDNVAQCSAVAYYFGRMLSDLLGVPVGLVVDCVGGTMAETWMPKEDLKAIPGITLFDTAPEMTGPGELYNGMIAPVAPFTAKGVIWYQGESNRYYPFEYASILGGMIATWRRAWNAPEMPFIQTQLAQFKYESSQGYLVPVLIEQQYKAAVDVPGVYVASTTDLGQPRCIHPDRKEKVGERLCAIALQKCYDIHSLYGESPRLTGYEVKGTRVALRFNNNAEDLWFNTFSRTDAESRFVEIKGFEIAGEDRVWHEAEAEFGEWPRQEIVVWSPDVSAPVAVRYAFRNVSDANLYTVGGVPLAPFRTDDWPIEVK